MLSDDMDLMAADDDDKIPRAEDETTLDRPSNTSPRTTSARRSRTAAEALARQASINNVTNMFQQHAMSQNFTTNKTAVLMSTTIINDAAFIAAFINKPDSLFAKIATECPLYASAKARSDMVTFVQANIDRLLQELVEANHAESRIERSEATRAACTHTYLDTIESLNNLASVVLIRERHLAAFLKTLDVCKSEMRANFNSNFNEEVYGRNDAQAGVCTTCDCAFDGEARMRRRLRMGCCGAHLCVECMRNHTYTNSRNGCSSKVNCVFCRK
jgi:hypothetical protein